MALLACAILLTSPSDDGVLVPTDAHMHSLLTPRAEEFSALADGGIVNQDVQAATVLWDYFHPAWDPSFHSLRSAQGVDMGFLAKDPSGRIEPAFQVSQARQRDLALFWASIYGEYNSQMRVVHDRNNPALVYGYIDFTPLFKRMAFLPASITADQLEQEIVENLTIAIRKQAGAHVKDTLDRENHTRLARLFAAHHVIGRKAIQTLAGDIRTQTGQSDTFRNAVQRSQAYLLNIESTFREHGLPRALARIPFVESSFNVGAKSRVGAMGLWQFVPRTARAFIHTDDESQWLDPLRQTEAAAVLLKQYRKHLPDWEAAVISYNSGIGRVSKLLRHYPGHSLSTILQTPGDQEKIGLGFAGRNYYAELLAANLVEAYKDEIFFPQTLEEKRASLRRELAVNVKGSCWVPSEEASESRPMELSTSDMIPKVVLAKLVDGRDGVNALIHQAIDRYSKWFNTASGTEVASLN